MLWVASHIQGFNFLRRRELGFSAHLTSDGTATEVRVALLLAHHGDLALKPDRAVQCPPPESDGRVGERFQLLRLAAAPIEAATFSVSRNG